MYAQSAQEQTDHWAARLRVGREAALGLAFAHLAHETGNGLGTVRMRLEAMLAGRGAADKREAHLQGMLERVDTLVELFDEWRTWLDDVPPLRPAGIDVATGVGLYVKPFARFLGRKNIHLHNACAGDKRPPEVYAGLELALGPVLAGMMDLFPPMACDLRLSGPWGDTLQVALHPQEPEGRAAEAPRFLATHLAGLERVARLEGHTLVPEGEGFILTIHPCDA